MKVKTLQFNILRKILLCPLILLLTSCTSIEQPATVADLDSRPNFPNIFSEKPQMVSLNDIHQLSPEQEQEFLTYFNNPAIQLIEQHQRLANYLFDNNFLYEYETYTASEALALNRGNCMSLAVVTTALANLANIQIDYQLISSSPVFQLRGSVANKGVHIRSLIYKPQEDDYSTPTGLKIDYFPSDDGDFVGNISDDQYIALYYRNIAAQRLTEENYSDAYWYTVESMKYDPLSPDAFNMMAITYKRIGDLAKAEEIYLYGIEKADNKLTLLKNYYILLTSQNRLLEARAINRRLLAMDDPSPIHWFNVARISFDANDFNGAIRYYNRAIEIAPYLHEAHLGIALSYYHLGRLRRAERAFSRAIINVNDTSTKDLYQAKLNALRSFL